MPTMMYLDGPGPVPVATEQELLDFANAVRTAGGANVIEALLPSTTKAPNACLIANALNFGCRVAPRLREPSEYKDGSWQWLMEFPENMSDSQRREIIDAVPGRAIRESGDRLQPELMLLLPKHIGNAARAFDKRLAFQKYAKSHA